MGAATIDRDAVFASGAPGHATASKGSLESESPSIESSESSPRIASSSSTTAITVERWRCGLVPLWKEGVEEPTPALGVKAAVLIVSSPFAGTRYHDPGQPSAVDRNMAITLEKNEHLPTIVAARQ
jgi:hypothetical protein